MYKIADLLADTIIRFLNELYQLDPEAIEKLVETRVPCNDKLADHPTVQVSLDPVTKQSTVGLLGIMNGLVGTRPDGYGYIAGVYDDVTGRLLSFARAETPKKP